MKYACLALVCFVAIVIGAYVRMKMSRIAPRGIAEFLRENPVSPNAFCHYMDISGSLACRRMFPEGYVTLDTHSDEESEVERVVLEYAGDDSIVYDGLDAGVCVRLSWLDERVRRVAAFWTELVTELVLFVRSGVAFLTDSIVLSAAHERWCDSEGRRRGNAPSKRIQSTSSAAAYCVPTAIIIAAKKSGTSTLVDWMGRHPQIRAPIFEQHFFDKVTLRRWRDYVFQSSFLLSSVELDEGVVTVEKTPNYLFHRDAAIRMHQMMPSALLIALLRDPVRRAYSGWHHNCRMRRYSLRRGTNDVVRVDQGTGNAPCDPDTFERYLWPDADNASDPLASGAVMRRLKTLQIVQRGLYADQLKMWTNSSLFDPSQFLLIFSENLVSSPFASMHRIESFLGVSHFDYRAIAFANDRGFWDIDGVVTKSDTTRPYAPMTQRAEYILTRVYAKPNAELSVLLRERFGMRIGDAPRWITDGRV
eukprot:g1018.t1